MDNQKLLNAISEQELFAFILEKGVGKMNIDHIEAFMYVVHINSLHKAA